MSPICSSYSNANSNLCIIFYENKYYAYITFISRTNIIIKPNGNHTFWRYNYCTMLNILFDLGYINFIVILQQTYIMWYYHFETKNYFCLFKLYLFHNATTNNSFFASLHYICRPPFKCILVLETLSNYYFEMHGSKL